MDNPARKRAAAAVRTARAALASAQQDLAALLRDTSITARDKNTTLIPAAQQKITRAEQALAAAEAARDKTPAKLPANVIDPEAKRALLRTCRHGLQMVLRLLACNAEHWLSLHLNAYLCDDDEYRAITRQTIIRGLAGVITYTPDANTVRLEEPGWARIPDRGGDLRLVETAWGCQAAIWYSCVSPPRTCFRRIWCSARLISGGRLSA